MSGRALTADRIRAALAKRYAPPAYAFVEELRRSTGWASSSRSADVAVMSLYPSRGLALEGFEIKAHRGDWARELKKPEKVEEGIYDFCTRWWVVAPPGVVESLELPSTWGLIEFHDEGPEAKRLREVVKAPLRQPKEPTWGLLGALLRRATAGTVPESQLAARVEAAVSEERERRDAHSHDDAAKLAKLRKLVKSFEDASGIAIHEWAGDERLVAIGKAARELAGDYRAVGHQVDRLHQIRAEVSQVLASIDSSLGVLSAIPESSPALEATA